MKDVKLTKAEQREYDLLKKHGSCLIESTVRNKLYRQLVAKGLAYTSEPHSRYPVWFGLVKETPSTKNND